MDPKDKDSDKEDQMPTPQLPRQVEVQISKSIDPQAFDPAWLKIIGSATAVGLICILFTWMVVRQVQNSDADVERNIRNFEKLQERADVGLEKHDTRMRDWMKSRDDRNALEVEKLKLEIKIVQESLKTVTELVRLIHDRTTKQP